jgi:hypothetical protein
MSVDKFGRHESSLVREVLRGPPGEGFQLTRDGHYDLIGKRLCNIADPIHKDEAVNLGTIRTFTLNFETNKDMFDAKNKKIIHVANGEEDTDAVNRKFVLEEIKKLKQDIYEKIDKLQSKAIIFTSSNKEGSGKSTNSVNAIYDRNSDTEETLPFVTHLMN